MEWLLQTVFFSVNLQLTLHGFCIHTDSHGRNLERSVQDIVPHQDIPVQFPIVVVRCSSVMLLTGSQDAADSLDEYGTVFLSNQVLPFLRFLPG